MRFIELSGQTLAEIAKAGHVSPAALQAAGVKKDCLVRVNEQGDIEIRRAKQWDIIGGLIGNFHDLLKEKTGRDYA